jgi:hypothetical protein
MRKRRQREINEFLWNMLLVDSDAKEDSTGEKLIQWLKKELHNVLPKSAVVWRMGGKILEWSSISPAMKGSG